MYSNGISAINIIGKLFVFKCKSYIEMLSSMMMVQIFAIVISAATTTLSTGTSSHGLSVSINYYSADWVIAFTVVWGLFSAMNVTSKAYRGDDFFFVTNQFTSHFSTILYLLAMGVVGGVTATLSSFLVRVLSYYKEESSTLLGMQMFPDTSLFVMGSVSTIVYVLLFMAAGYLAGIIIQWHRLLKIILPVVLIGILLLQGNDNLLVQLHEFFYQESSFFVFTAKSLGTLLLMFGVSIVLANRLEVKQ